MAYINGKKVLTINNTVYVGDDIILDATPKGVYASLSALQTAYPTGSDGIYLTSDNGHWYYYDTGWQDGGVYQAGETDNLPNENSTNALSNSFLTNKGMLFREFINQDATRDLNNISNGWYIVNSTCLNKPDAYWGYVIQFTYNANYKMQIYISSPSNDLTANNIYYRQMINGTWHSWTGLNSTVQFKEFINNDSTRDFNTLTSGWYQVYGTITNKPNNDAGMVLTFKYNDNFYTQIYISYNSQLGQRFYYRVKFNGTWVDWSELSAGATSEDYSLGSVALFSSIGVIGDSFTAGFIQLTTDTYQKNYRGLSWVKSFAKRNGMDYEIYAKHGLTTETWLTDSEGLTKLQNSQKVCNLYMICLGINDSNSQTLPLGSLSDISSDLISSANSYYGNLAKIVYYIRQKNTNACIYISTLPFNTTAYNNAVIEVATYLGIGYCKLHETEECKYLISHSNVYELSHPNVAGQTLLSKAIEKAMNYSMTNLTYAYLQTKDWSE